MWEFCKAQQSRRSVDLVPLSPAASNTPHHETVSFKDLSIHLQPQNAPCDGKDAKGLPQVQAVERKKLIIIVVGLPGRGKTFVCNKLVSYLSWIGHDALHFNVGQYRRQLGADDAPTQDAAFFDHKNKIGMEMRQKALEMALDALISSLNADACQVALVDATNSTEQRRRFLIEKFHGKYEYMFIESICNDEEVLEQNYRYKMQYSPDYSGMDDETAMKDFKARIEKYTEVYEPIRDRNLHYIKLINMITGHGHLDVNRISGYLGGKIVFFLMQVNYGLWFYLSVFEMAAQICKAGCNQLRKIWLTRHGESEYNRMKRIGGDSCLSEKGKCYAQVLPQALAARFHSMRTNDDGTLPLTIWTSTLRRTNQTAQHLAFPNLRWKALDEINAGRCDGMSYKEIAETMPAEFEARKRNKLTYRYPFGESYLDVIQRLEPVITEIEREQESICVIAHQAVIRALCAYFLRIPLDRCPKIDTPLHTIIELTPKPDGTLSVEQIPVKVPSPPCSPSTQPVMRFVDTATLSRHPSGKRSTDSDVLSRSM